MNEDRSGGASVRGSVLAVLLGGLLAAGLPRWWLGTLGYDTLGTGVFVVVYAATLLFVWHRWLRDIDFVGPVGDDGS